MHACSSGHLELVAQLLEHGAAIDEPDSNGATPLILACISGHLNIVNRLLEHGVAIDQADSNGATPLIHAYESGHLEIVEQLLDSGASDARMPDNFLPYHLGQHARKLWDAEIEASGHQRWMRSKLTIVGGGHVGKTSTV